MKFDRGICLITEDVLRLVKFYEMVLQAQAKGDEIHSEIEAGGGALAIYSKAAAIRDMGFNFDKYHGTGMFTFAFNFQSPEDVDREFERLKSLDIDIEFIIPPTTHPWGARAMHFRDPDGNIVCFRGLNG